jgi:hypothetical protein
VLDTTFKDTTTLPMELLKRLSKHGMKKKAQRGFYCLNSPFSISLPFIESHQLLTQWWLRSPLSVEYHMCDPNILTRLKKRANSWNLRIFQREACSPAIASLFKSKLKRSSSKLDNVESLWTPLGGQKVASTQSAKATAHYKDVSPPHLE